MHALILLYINQYMIFEVSSFTNYKDMIESKILEGVMWLWPHRPHPFQGWFVAIK